MAKDLEDWYLSAALRLRPPDPKRQPEDDGSGRFTVTLNLERLLAVDADDREQALDMAVRWRSNEDDDRVAVLYEELTGSRDERAKEDE